jgi:hypothetical protein
MFNCLTLNVAPCLQRITGWRMISKTERFVAYYGPAYSKAFAYAAWK